MSKLHLPRFRTDTPLIDTYGRPTQAFMIWWQQVCKQLEEQINTINSQVAGLIATAQSTATAAGTAAATAQSTATSASTAAATAQSTATTAVSNAATAQSTATSASTAASTADSKAVASLRQASRVNSYPNPGSILTGTDAGVSATISIASHTRVYPIQGTYKVPDVSISSGSITGLAYSTFYYVYYDDTTLTVTNPTFIATTNAATAQVGAADGRHFVGFITTPAAAAPPTTGDGGGTPGGGGGGGGGHQGGWIP
jgi:hypothetical protein